MILYLLMTACVSFFTFWLLLQHLSETHMRRLVGYKAYVDVTLHITIFIMFIGTSTLGLLQAEAAGIMFSIYLRAYGYLYGYERWNKETKTWDRFHGVRA